MEAPFEPALVGNELRSRIAAFGRSGTLSARLSERQLVEAKVVIDLDTQVVDLTDTGVEPV